MEQLLQSILGEFGPIEWFIFWLFLFLIPIGAFAGAIDAFRGRETGKGVGFLSAGIVLLTLIGLLVMNFGKRLVQLTVDSLGGWVIGLLIAGVVCLVALPMSLVGSQLRAAFEYGRRGYGSRGGISFFVGLGGLLVIVGVALIAFQSDTTIGLGFSVLTLIALVLGWFGRFLVPEIIEEGGEPLEAPEGVRGKTPPPLTRSRR